MRSIKINFGGESAVSVDWNAEVTGLRLLTQKVGMGVITELGSDKAIPSRGTETAKSLLSVGVFDFVRIQHVLNFSALKVRRDIQSRQTAITPESLQVVRMTLVSVKDRKADIAIDVVTNAGTETQTLAKMI
jgi:hypothetical protein